MADNNSSPNNSSPSRDNDSQKDGDKQKKSPRSFGSFLLFLLVLLAILFMVASDSLSSSTELTQDQYKWRLYTGQIDSQEFNSQDNRVEGRLSNNGGPFSVSFAELGEQEALFQSLKSVRNYPELSADSLRAAVEGEWYQPKHARVISTYEYHEEQGTNQSDSEASTESKPNDAGRDDGRLVRADDLYVSVLARSGKSWDSLNRAERPPLPEDSGTMWLKVGSTADLGSLVGYLESKGATTELLSFDVSKNKGSVARSTNSMMQTILFIYGPWILIIGVFFLFMRQMRGQGGAGGVMSFGRSRAQLYSKETHTGTTFDDVAGNTEAKDEVREVVEFLKNPGRFTRIGGRIPRGILLVGPPGCGKTLLAKAIAGEAEVPFFSISGSDFVEMFVGVGASRVRDLFKQARENNPCIIFLDEIDAVGRRRGSGMGGGHDEREQTLNAILVEMDGFATDEGIIIIAATNRPDVLDPALLRPGRFDREVTIDLPDLEGREAILTTHLKKVKSSPQVDIKTLARSTPGYSGADLAAVINEAAIAAVLDKKDEVEMEHLEEARDKVRYGRQKKSHKIELEDRKITAFHEAGHAIVATVIDETDPPHKVTIVPRGRALGTTMMLPEKESYHHQKKRLVGQLAVLFGGRASEARFCGDISAGASDDIKRATELARAMVTELGMSERVGPINYAERQGSDFLGTELMSNKWHSEETAREIDEEIQLLLRTAYETAERIVSEHSEAIQKVTDGLLKHETITGQEIDRLLDGVSLDDLRPDPPASPPPAPVTPNPTPRVAPASGEDDLPGDIKPGFSPA